jgi:hypothetical protein
METQKPENKPKAGPPVYVKYIGLSFQLFGIIGAGTWLGWWIQQKSNLKFPVWILVGCFASIALAFYQLIKSVERDK